MPQYDFNSIELDACTKYDLQQKVFFDLSTSMSTKLLEYQSCFYTFQMLNCLHVARMCQIVLQIIGASFDDPE